MKAFMVTDENGEQTVVIAADWWDAMSCYVADQAEAQGEERNEVANSIDSVALLSNFVAVSWLTVDALIRERALPASTDEPSPGGIEPNG